LHQATELRRLVMVRIAPLALAMIRIAPLALAMIRIAPLALAMIRIAPLALAMIRIAPRRSMAGIRSVALKRRLGHFWTSSRTLSQGKGRRMLMVYLSSLKVNS
jgi:hypothetical protein